ncbi:acyl dehydratase [Nocardioides daedukensis]|uniref:Acyl dehydratase n=1 Tax=Nocardioides daedukensis TaxID=634462 RepID=A0A7Y9S3A5_9ACTN|nr:MaoC/PaaZ C-terminal domain-containing protein [Nocardioides daedukensis]NYG59762.1 acyl dehydratase [Nocardioides daedukensis]
MTTTPLTVGDHLTDLVIEPISRTTLALFAGASGDHNPVHIDSDVAASAGLDDVFAHGMLSMAYLARLLTDNFGIDNVRSYRTRFASITPVHGQPTCRGVVREVSEVDGERLATLDLTVELSDGTTTMLGEAVISLD